MAQAVAQEAAQLVAVNTTTVVEVTFAGPQPSHALIQGDGIALRVYSSGGDGAVPSGGYLPIPIAGPPLRWRVAGPFYILAVGGAGNACVRAA